jgi:hypothetical protein
VSYFHCTAGRAKGCATDCAAVCSAVRVEVELFVRDRRLVHKCSSWASTFMIHSALAPTHLLHHELRNSVDPGNTFLPRSPPPRDSAQAAFAAQRKKLAAYLVVHAPTKATQTAKLAPDVPKELCLSE